MSWYKVILVFSSCMIATPTHMRAAVFSNVTAQYFHTAVYWTWTDGGGNDYFAVRELTADFLSFRASWSWPIWMEVDLTTEKKSQNHKRMQVSPHTPSSRLLANGHTESPLTYWSVPSHPSACLWSPSGLGTETKVRNKKLYLIWVGYLDIWPPLGITVVHYDSQKYLTTH